MASMTFGPPGWQTQAVISSTVSPWQARKELTLRAKPPLDHVGQFRRQHDAEAVGAQPPAQRVAAVGIHLAARRDDPQSFGGLPAGGH